MNWGRLDGNLRCPRSSHASILWSHHLLRHDGIIDNIVKLIESRQCQSQADLRQVLTDAIPGAIAEGPQHVFHFFTCIQPPLRFILFRLWEYTGVPCRGVGRS